MERPDAIRLQSGLFDYSELLTFLVQVIIGLTFLVSL